jgi:hypothetical protein
MHGHIYSTTVAMIPVWQSRSEDDWEFYRSVILIGVTNYVSIHSCYANKVIAIKKNNDSCDGNVSVKCYEFRHIIFSLDMVGSFWCL